MPPSVPTRRTAYLTVEKARCAVRPADAGRDGFDGEDADPEPVAALVAEQVEKAVAAIPVPKDGEPGRDGIDGKDADPETVAALVAEQVEKAVAAIAAPKDGERGRDGIDGKDGGGLAGFGIDGDRNGVVEGERVAGLVGLRCRRSI